MIVFLKLWASFVNTSKDYDEILSIFKHEVYLNRIISLYDRPSVGSYVKSII